MFAWIPRSVTLSTLSRALSSVYNMRLNILIGAVLSFIHIMNNTGPKIEPWGTPVVIMMMSDFVLSRSTYCCLLFK